jgi:hypothetical protein
VTEGKGQHQDLSQTGRSLKRIGIEYSNLRIKQMRTNLLRELTNNRYKLDDSYARVAGIYEAYLDMLFSGMITLQEAEKSLTKSAQEAEDELSRQ